jgi:hypothetical protein
MVLHSRLQEWLLAGGPAFGWQREDCILDSHVLWELRDMHSGLCNTPVTFELLMETIL